VSQGPGGGLAEVDAEGGEENDSEFEYEETKYFHEGEERTATTAKRKKRRQLPE